MKRSCGRQTAGSLRSGELSCDSFLPNDAKAVAVANLYWLWDYRNNPPVALPITYHTHRRYEGSSHGQSKSAGYTLTQHRLLSQLRAIEGRKHFLRCAATGETCSISATGQIVDRLAVQRDGVLLADAPLLDGQTLFTRAPWLGAVLSLVALMTVVLQHRKSW